MKAQPTPLSLSAIVQSRAADHLREYRHELTAALGGRLTEVILFGSRARRDAEHDSDYDVAVFIEALEDRRDADNLLADLAYPHIIAGFHIRPFALPASALNDLRATALTANIARDGVVIA